MSWEGSDEEIIPMPLKVAFIVSYPLGRSPGQRFRFEQWLELMPEKSAIDSTIYPLFDLATYGQLYSPGGVGSKSIATIKGLLRRVREIASASRKADVVFMYREAFPLGPPLLEMFLERRTPVVYDFDDAIFLGDTSAANSFVARFKNPTKVGKIIERSAMTTVGNEFLAEYARRFSDNVRLLPTTIDTEKYQPSFRRKKRSLVRVGWSGSRTTSAHLDFIRPVLVRALRDFPIELYVIGDPDYRLPESDRVVIRPWDERAEVEEISSFDIGIMPLPDDDWSRGKCGLKALQYMALEVPPIVSPVGVNDAIVSHGVNGLVAKTGEEWLEAISALVEDESYRRRLGMAARETVQERYSGQLWAPVFHDLLVEAASKA